MRKAHTRALAAALIIASTVTFGYHLAQAESCPVIPTHLKSPSVRTMGSAR
jgi:hypothetical protein